MMTFLTVLLGVVAGLAVFAGLLIWWLRRKLYKLGDALGHLAGALAGGVPPFRITLQANRAVQWQDDTAVAELTADLEGLGYEQAGDYDVPEMEGVHVRGFCNRRQACAAALYEHPQAGILLDLLRLHKDHTHVLVTAAPETGMEDPPRKRTIRVESPPDVPAMHARLLQACAGLEPVPLTPAIFPVMFTTAYAAEMDWRIERGGVTREEVIGAALAGGQDEPDDASIALVQMQWRGAIEEHWKDMILDAFLKSGAVSAAEWEGYRERVCVVHADTDPDDLAVELANCAMEAFDDEDDDFDYDEHLESLNRELKAAIGAKGEVLRNAPRAMELLPADRRLRLLGEVERPRQALIFLMPEAV